jgi:hypothetical protein
MGGLTHLLLYQCLFYNKSFCGWFITNGHENGCWT